MWNVILCALAVGPDIHVHFVGCEEMKKRENVTHKSVHIITITNTITGNVSNTEIFCLKTLWAKTRELILKGKWPMHFVQNVGLVSCEVIITSFVIFPIIRTFLPSAHLLLVSSVCVVWFSVRLSIMLSWSPPSAISGCCCETLVMCSTARAVKVMLTGFYCDLRFTGSIKAMFKVTPWSLL